MQFCGEEVGINKRYFIIKSKNFLSSYAGSFCDNINCDMCEDCMQEFATYLHSKLRGKRMKKAFETIGVFVISLFFISIPILCTLSFVYSWFAFLKIIFTIACLVDLVGLMSLLVDVVYEHD